MKKDGRCNVPQWLHDEWKNGDHAELARQYAKCGFDKANSSSQLVSAKCPHKVIALGISIFPSSGVSILSWQDQFIKYKKLTSTKTKKESSDVAVGWYSKEDMQKVLKWNANLFCINCWNDSSDETSWFVYWWLLAMRNHHYFIIRFTYHLHHILMTDMFYPFWMP